jgi:hypothetical protein
VRGWWTRMQGPRSASPQLAPSTDAGRPKGFASRVRASGRPCFWFGPVEALCPLCMSVFPAIPLSLYGLSWLQHSAVASERSQASKTDALVATCSLLLFGCLLFDTVATATPCCVASPHPPSLTLCVRLSPAVRGAAGAHQGRRGGPSGCNDRVCGGGGGRIRVHANQRRPAAVGQLRRPLATAALQRRGARGARVHGGVAAHRPAAHAGHDSSYAGERWQMGACGAYLLFNGPAGAWVSDPSACLPAIPFFGAPYNADSLALVILPLCCMGRHVCWSTCSGASWARAWRA